MKKMSIKTKIFTLVVISFLLAMQFLNFYGLTKYNTPPNHDQGDPPNVNIPFDVSKNEIKEYPFESQLKDSGYFTENLGQWEEHIKFSAKTDFGYVGLSDDGVYYYVAHEESVNVVKIVFKNANLINPEGKEDMGFSSNYFYGRDASKWVTEARSFKKVVYHNAWVGIDIVYYFKNENLKYDIIADEYSNPDFISFDIKGHRYLNVENGELKIIITENTHLIDSDLKGLYENGESIPCEFIKLDENSYGFKVQKEYGRRLIIDPVILSQSTFLGGSGGEMAHDITTDSAGNIIVVGGTGSNDYPNTTGAIQNFFAGAFDVVVTKMNPDASDIIFSTYMGDWSTDYGYGIEVDENDDIYITGMTYSWYFPTTNGSFQESDPSMGFPDAFVSKLASTGNQLLYSTYVGGTSSDTAFDIKVLNGEAYVVGNALSYDFPSAGPGVGDAHGTIFFFILNHNGTNLTNSAFWGGFSNDFGYSLYIDNNDDVVVGGVSYSSDFPTTSGVYMAAVNDTANGIILKYRPSTGSLIFSTYIGADASDNVHSVYVDDMGDIYFTGITAAPAEGANPYPTTSGAFDRIINGGNDIFVTKMDSMGTGLMYSTYFGGDGDEDPGKIDVDENGNVYMTGKTTLDVNFSLTSDCYDDTYNGDEDAFVMILNNVGTNLIYSSFLGGNAYDAGEACVLTDSKDLLVFGSSSSTDFPVTSGSYQTANKGNSDLFITKFNIGNKMYLQEGWNLISVPLIQSDTNLGSVLSSISGYYDAVQWYDPNDPQDPWKHNHILKSPEANDLQNLNHMRGFWVHITEPGITTYNYSGSQPGINQKIQLKVGWNMVGYPSMAIQNRTEGLNNLIFQKEVDCIQWYDTASQTWHFMEEEDTFVPGRGYWIRSKFPANWEVQL